MSPILTRPVREQLEHDRVIRLLQARYKRKNDVIINPGGELNQPVTVENLVVYPDLLLLGEDGKRLVGTIEVETAESVNALEARAEWAVFCKLRVPLHLYVPAASVDTARRLCAEYDIPVAEVWSFTTNFDQVRFTLVHKGPDAPMAKVTIVIKPVVKPKPEVEEPAPAPPSPAVAAKPVTAKAAPAKPTAAKAQPAVKPVAAKTPVKPAPPVKVVAPAKAKAKPVSKPAARPAAKASKAKAKPVAKAKPAAKAAKPAKKAAKPAKPIKPVKPVKPAKKRR